METTISNRIRISFFGRRNVGKSSLINAICNQNVSIISNNPGTTTDPVNKTMELLPLGPVVLTDTAGFDDEGDLGQLRIKKTIEVLNKTDIVILVLDINQSDFSHEKNFIERVKKLNKEYIIVANKDDLNEKPSLGFPNIIYVSTLNNTGIDDLKSKISHISLPQNEVSFLEGLVCENKVIVLVCPIDSSAPKDRLILPQVMAIRDILNKKGICITCQVSQLTKVLSNVTPSIVITDSQVFKEVNSIVPSHIALTSFSILMAKFKGDLNEFVKGAEVIDTLKSGDKILISEACTHHAEKNDIGRVQIPNKLKSYTKADLVFDYINGNTFPEDLCQYKLIIHCGACMISRTMMLYRQSVAKEANVPITNYGVILAKLNGILDRVKL